MKLLDKILRTMGKPARGSLRRPPPAPIGNGVAPPLKPLGDLACPDEVIHYPDGRVILTRRWKDGRVSETALSSDTPFPYRGFDVASYEPPTYTDHTEETPK